MNNKSLPLIAMLLCSMGAPFVQAATDWSTGDYDLYPGDFDGDGRTDVLYVAKDVSKASGIARSNGNGPNLPFQSWPANYLGIPWAGNVYIPIVADFNGDDKADIFLQRSTPGDHYLLLADGQGKITGISQAIPNTYLTLVWSADKHRILAGDIDGDGKADLFLQATNSAGASAVVLANANGQFTVGPRQTLYDGDLGFKWSTASANVFIGDFNGDGKKDLLVQAKPKIVLIDYDIPIPVPTYPPNMNGIALSQGGTTPFQLAGVQLWSRKDKGVDWSPNTANIIVGNFDGAIGDDILLQARSSGQPSYLLVGHASGTIITSASTLASNVTWSAGAYRLIAGNFDGTGGAGVYYQAQSSTGTNYYANVITGASVSVTAHDPTSATGVVPASAVGHTVGSFAVSNTGAATYSIPVVVPPGVAGMQPALSINYQSSVGNGLLGVGWGLGGLSEIERCGKTLAQDDSTDSVALTTADRFCLDGNKLRLTSGTYGVSGSTYQTEIETFSRVKAYGTSGNGPTYFTVEAKDGLVYEYGNSTDSRIEAINAPANSTTPHTWALNKVSDRHGNTMTISYQEDGAPNGSFRPREILYTSNANASLAAAYKVVFEWDTRSANDALTAYVAGGLMRETYRLNRIETRYNDPAVGNWRLVRKYQLSYNTSGSTPRTRLGAVQECDRNAHCLSPTMISWQDGGKGWESSDTSSSSNSAAMMEYSYPIDINGDGRDDLVYPQVVSGTARWHFMKGNGAGGFDSPVNTGIDAGDATNLQYARGQPIDYYSEGRLGLLVQTPGHSTRQILRWNGTTLALTNTNLTVSFVGREWVADFDGDGRADLAYAINSGGADSIYVQKNAGSVSATAQFSTADLFHSATNPIIGPGGVWLRRVVDFNADARADLIYATLTSLCPGGPPCTYITTWVALISTGASFVTSQAWYCTLSDEPCLGGPVLGDYNGDGLTDVITHADGAAGSRTWEIRYGSGAGLTSASTLSMPSDFNAGSFSADYDRDGSADLLYAPSPTSGNWYVMRSTGSGFESAVNIGLSSSSANNTVRLLDVDGDGQQDVGFKSTQFRVRKHNGVAAQFVSAIADGFGNTVSVAYAPLTDSTVYTKGSGAEFPKMDVQIPAYVVKSYSVSDGIGGSYSVTQKYAGLRVHLQGRGLLGFEHRESVDSRTQIKSTWEFSQDFPYIGLVSESGTYQSGGLPIATVENAFNQLSVQGGTHEKRWSPYIEESVQTNYEVGGGAGVNGEEISRVTTTTSLSDYGNPLTVTSTTQDLTGSGLTYITTTASSYADATCEWRGFATQQQVTNTVPGYSAQPRTVGYVRDPVNASAGSISKSSSRVTMPLR